MGARSGFEIHCWDSGLNFSREGGPIWESVVWGFGFFKVWDVRRTSIAGFLSLLRFRPEGSLLGIRLPGVDSEFERNHCGV